MRVRATSEARGIGAAALVLTTAYVVSRVLGLLRQTAINAEFGLGPETDAFWAAFRPLDVVYNLLVGGALVSVFVPVYARLVAEQREADAWSIFNTVINVVTVALLLVGGIVALFADTLAPWLAPGFSPATQHLTARLTQALVLQPAFLGAGVVAMAALNARKHFLLPAYGPVLYNLGIVAGALVIAPRFGIVGLATGVTLGAIAYFLLQVPGLMREGLPYRLAVRLDAPEVLDVVKLLVPRTLGLASGQIGGLVTMVTLASLLPSGSVTALTIAMQLLLVPVGVLGVALSTAAFPSLAEFAAKGDLDSLAALARRTLRFMTFIAAPTSVLLVVLRRPIVGLLLQHGKFDLNDLNLTAYALLCFAVALCSHVVDELLPRVLYALRDTFTPLIVNVGIVIVNVALSAALLGRFQLGGVALGLSLAATIEAVVFLVILQRRVPALLNWNLCVDVGRIVLAAFAMTLVLLAFTRVAVSSAPVPNVWREVIEVGAGTLLGGLVYLFVATLLGSEDAWSLRDRARRLLVRRPA